MNVWEGVVSPCIGFITTPPGITIRVFSFGQLRGYIFLAKTNKCVPPSFWTSAFDSSI